MSFSPKIKGDLAKIINYLPYKHSIFFQKPLMFSKKNIQSNRSSSKKLFDLINSTEKKSLLDYTYWETKMLYQISNNRINVNFERNFTNLVILSKNNEKKQKSLKLYYLRNVPRFSKEIGDMLIAN